ncbi:Sto1p NDAI_0H02800 [Naumovozyma dairenensis CBS 421]|uniref:Nuclear cap-binding protein complex subunit 1 n=1 Tax=Naumovozyma dairenensis (strain ATCC 10597 / BCRC 20456 / CBS 421 / NBRC 0211 / NRRL Y-12639) TaxID=1071378 RepID=G0WF93_NAUDC|nr:hypothetical protein NDAI_0H02800 [Naumovozyma dairenensis CBS 421]CCD26454.1 hypothetical protein NDAI_0H02800 [Naumovozyma dairenensis CBS 421]
MFNRKRKGDFDEDDGYRDFRPRAPKRQRIPPVVQLCKEMMPDICTIGESLKAFEDDIKFLSEAIINEYGHEDYFNEALLKTLYSVVVEQPQKQAAIALLTMVVNAENNVAGKSIINFFFEQLQHNCKESINDDFQVTSNETGPWNKVKLILRYLSMLSPIMIKDDIIAIYKRLFELAVELNNKEETKRVPLSEAIYVNTLLNIPALFVFNKTDESLQQKVEELITYVETNYKIKQINVDLLREYNTSSPYPVTELIQIALPNVKEVLANNMEKLYELYNDWSEMYPTKGVDESGFNDALELPTVEQLESFVNLDRGFGSVDSMWKTPRYIFHVYLPNSTGNFETVVPITTYAGQLFNDIIIDIVESLEFNRKEVAKQVVTLDLFYKPGIFAEAGSSIADLIQSHEENPSNSTYKIEDLAIETILSLIFKLPNVSQPFAYFYTLLVDICQDSPKAIAPVFGRAFRFFYNNLDDLDFELKLRYLDWFSIQMSNFNFSWKWKEWENDSIKFNGIAYNPKVNFIKNLIHKEIRLTSNLVEVEDSLPEEFKQYLNTSFISNDKMMDYYQSLFTNHLVTMEDVKVDDLFFKLDSVPMEAQVRQILDYIHKPNNQRELKDLEEIINTIKEEYGNEITDFTRFVIIVIMQAVVHSGSRSLSHANKYINDLRDELLEIFSKLEMDQDLKEYTMIEAVLRYWNTNSQNGFLIVDALKFAKLVSTKSIYDFCFDESNLNDGINHGLIESTAIEAIFRNLSQELISNPQSVADFEIVFEKLCIIVNGTIKDLGVQEDEDIVVPNVSSDMDIDFTDVNESRRFNLSWKYATVTSFIKSLLRKYSDEYRVLVDKFNSGIENAIPHEPTRAQISKWINEVNSI